MSERKMVQGGSFYSYRRLARSAYRGRFIPRFRLSGYGFRVVMNRAIEMSKIHPVLRGGSFFLDREFVRCACRFVVDPYLGFRVVVNRAKRKEDIQ